MSFSSLAHFPNDAGFSGRKCLFYLPPEISQVRWRLAFLRRHQVAVVAEHIVLAAQKDMLIGFNAGRLGPDRPRLRGAAIILGDRPRPREGAVVDRDFV